MSTGAPVDPEWRKVLIEGHKPLRVVRQVYGAIPSSPRCKVCNNPFGGAGGRMFAIAGVRPSRKNPTVCNRCFEKMGPGGAEVDIAVLFADVRGSTVLGAGMDAGAFAEMLNRFYKVATDVLVRHDALIDKLIGDEVMALFIPGLAGKDYRRRAVEAAADLLHGIGYGTPQGAWLDVGVGINAGVAYVGNVGPAGITDFTALGDCVNMAARLQAHAAAGEIVIADGVDACVGERWPTAEGRALELRGREAPMPAHIVAIR